MSVKPPKVTTNLWSNPYVHQVLEFMQATVPPDQLCGVADAVARVAPALWYHHGQQRIVPLVLFKAEIPAADSKQESAGVVPASTATDNSSTNT